MSIVRNLLFGRPEGLRAKLRGLILDKLLGPMPTAAREDNPRAAEPITKAPPPAPAPEAAADEGYTAVMEASALLPGQVKEVVVGPAKLAVANVGGEFFACSNVCPHLQGPLGRGDLDGHFLACPDHGFEFDLRTGEGANVSGFSVPTFPVKVQGTSVCVKVDAAALGAQQDAATSS